jgi:hypothetical protein
MLTNMQVYDKAIKTVAIELVAQNIDAFNAASGGALLLSTEGFEGDFMKQSQFAGISGAFYDVDRYAAPSNQSGLDLSEIEKVSVKTAGGAKINLTPSDFTWMETSEQAAILAIATGIANGILADQLNKALLSAAAAIGNNSSANLDISGTAGISQSGINAANGLFGDRSQALSTIFMNGAGRTSIIGENLANASTLFNAGNVTVLNVLGQLVVVTDSPAFYVPGTPNEGKALMLQAGGVTVGNTTDIVTNLERTNGQSPIQGSYMVDYAFSIGIKGYAWDMANGGKSPVTGDLGTGANWDQYVDSVKDTAGVLLTYDADQ